MSIRPSVGKRFRFKVWHDIEYVGKVYTDGGNGEDRPSDVNEWTGEVIGIDKRFHIFGSTSSRDQYAIKRDFDGFIQYNYANELTGYVE
ncbi:hypothetical protein NDS46_31695 (plasmid) [Paenibacillus thiaminolyticus]|uniref:hypothetical protein n=1 Tax=Paenibacillus thiaminolyticus TaxID=49283 RepID=UPI00232C4EC0|nr:hypothetical protein [Paenibacillus thiaminolyticus]WCF11523.1 hypothetical protein NDS46_31695 [Paenibacillus thiaminolyticus]